MSKKFRVIIDFDFSTKKNFTYDFRFVNISNPGYEIGGLELVEHLKEVLKSLEQKHFGTEELSVKDTKLYH